MASSRHIAHSTAPADRGLSTRAYAGLPATVDTEKLSFDVTIATETPVRTYIANPHVTDPQSDKLYIEVDEVLTVAGFDASRTSRMPFLDSHNSYDGIGKILGRVDDVRAAGDAIVGTVVLRSAHAELMRDISEGFYGQVSAGFCVNSYEIIEREGDVPLARATSWTLHECSLVAVGADPNAMIRGARSFPAPTISYRNLQNSQEKSMSDLTALVETAEAAIAAADEAIAAVVEAEDEGAEAAIVERAKAIRARAETEEPAPVEDGERSEDEMTADEAKAEERALASARSVAKNYGLDAFVTDLVTVGARSAEIMKALRGEIAKRGATATTSTKPAPVKQRSSEPITIDTTAIYARRNKRQ